MTQQTISQPQRMPASQERRVDLDWVRILAFGLLIFYHVGMLYVSWDFHIKSDHRVTALEPLMLVLNPWRLALLFLVSGVATRFMLQRMTPLPLLRSRSVRLLIPLLFGMLVIVPPQSYLQIVEAFGYPAGFIDFYVQHYLAFGRQFCPNPCIMLPTWNHLWFIVYLWVYTMALGALLMVLPGLRGWIEGALSSVLAGGRLLALPALLFAAYRLLLYPNFPVTHELLGDWYSHAQFATIFVVGFAIARVGEVWDNIERQRWPALLLAMLLFASFLALRSIRGGLPLKMYAGFAYGCYQWFFIVAVLGFARRWLAVDSPARRYLTDAIFPYYIVHQTAIIAIAHALHGQGLPASLEATIVIAGTAATCALSYEIVRRVNVLRPLFGLKAAAVPAVLRTQGQPAE